VAAADWLREHHQAPQILIGHSLGGAAVLAGAHRVPECKAVATIGAPYDPEHVTGHFGDELHQIVERGSAQVSVGGRPFTIERHFLEDISAHNMKAAIAKLDRALIIFHAPRDETVGIENAEILANAGFDWLIFDLEHSMIEMKDLLAMIAVTENKEVASLVRVPRADSEICKKVLDAGCWWGWFIRFAREHGADVEGFDYEQSRIDDAVLFLGESSGLRIGDIKSIHSSDSSFDVLYREDSNTISLKKLVSSEFGSTESVFILVSVDNEMNDVNRIQDIRHPGKSPYKYCKRRAERKARGARCAYCHAYP